MGDRTESRNITVDSFRGRTVTIHYSNNRTVRNETGDEGTEIKIESVGDSYIN